MQLQDGQLPIYVQIAQWLEIEIIEQRIEAHGKIFSQYQLAEKFNVNPATAGKGLTILLEKELLYKKRGLGMFVMEGARERLMEERLQHGINEQVTALVEEARRLNISKKQLLQLIEQAFRKGGNE
ncbi:GntR family transcriptional regulator [Kurthia huakuii]|uniref:GntR family transcriptional regulator n=1 Tax=Kurthia huakuii TaxID=1421019 RepID=UPI0004956751|nr:GntR family transcriptional regulator [Kurthia huakuii]MBM7699234.1 DNA-binding transcriptional regulator YhcF (GntR family) [Kurthia huakuii]